MKKILVIFVFVFAYFLSFNLTPVYAENAPTITTTSDYYSIPLQSCRKGGCPTDLQAIYAARKEICTEDFDLFRSDPITYHYWIEDPKITAQGKADERARQFIYWVLNNKTIDDHPTLRAIWNVNRNLSYFFVILAAALMGLGIIIGQRTRFQINISVWPTLLKIGGALLYITFSAAIILLLIQLSELVMKFFIENLGGKDLFNIYFSASTSQEKNYLDFIGCRDLNYRVQEGANTELFMLNLTNITYYMMGTMLLLRKILLWFMLFVSPFLAVLFPFVLIRNIGIVWIGVFFQWLFYGPLFALFLGALAQIWKNGMPFVFDFQRGPSTSTDPNTFYIYPTAINILYGGPAQKLGATNSGNYIDTFMEYAITIIMLWAVTFFPWWLLRIFRDYCCDGIYAMKNIMLSLYDQMRGNATPMPLPPASPMSAPASTSLYSHVTEQQVVNTVTRMETVEEIHKTRTEDITRNLNISANKLTDIARFETNKQTQESVRKNIEYLSNPMKADTPSDRQKYMNIRSELLDRAMKNDNVAKQILSATTSSRIDQIQNRQDILKSTPVAVPVAQAVSIHVNLPQDKIQALSTSFMQAVAHNSIITNIINQTTSVPVNQIQTILTSYGQQVNKPANQIIRSISKETSIPLDKVNKILTAVSIELSKADSPLKQLIQTISKDQNISAEDLTKVLTTQIPIAVEPEKHVEQNIPMPSTISIEDYEEVKKMWTEQYEKGEVPVTENIQSRAEWVEQDVVFITNTLNKLLSSDDELRQQGLDEMGY
ncbi:hypothetical protein HGB07_03155, partial [Candidatus Roizmanbacteria bacterium]|nr:hypothetical protein [Candidatus Roizmanbacteria bacterium]